MWLTQWYRRMKLQQQIALVMADGNPVRHLVGGLFVVLMIKDSQIALVFNQHS